MTWRSRTTLYPDRASWLAARTQTLGASEAAALLGVSPFAGPWDVYTAKRGGPPVPEADEVDESGGVDLNDPKIRGQVLEPMIGACYTAVTGRSHQPIGVALGGCATDVGITRHRDQPWLSCSLDALVFDRVEAIGEWKSDKHSYRWGTSGIVLDGTWGPHDRVIPGHIFVQVLVQLAVTDLLFADVAVFTGGLAFRHFRVLRHEPTIAGVVDELGTLWRRHIVDGVPPDLDSSKACVAACREALQANRTKSRRATPDEEQDIAILLARRDAEDAAEAAKARLLSAMGENKSLWLPPGPRGEPRGVRVDVRGSVRAL